MKTKTAVLQHKQVAFQTKSVEDTGIFSGYGSVFGNVDSYGEVCDPGCFVDSLKAIKSSGDPLPALWQHLSSQPIGGYDTLAEDDHGLAVTGFLLVDDLPLAKQALALMKRRVVKGLSIGYYVEDAFYNEKTGVYHLKKLDLVEISIVTFPANADAQVDAVKSMQRNMSAGQLPTLKDFEGFLREAGFSKTQACAVAAKGLSQLLRRSESGSEPDRGITHAFEALQSFTL